MAAGSDSSPADGGDGVCADLSGPCSSGCNRECDKSRGYTCDRATWTFDATSYYVEEIGDFSIQLQCD